MYTAVQGNSLYTVTPVQGKPLYMVTPVQGKPLYIGIAGLIGCGKTELTKVLSKHLAIPAYYESVATNPYLTNFYKDMKRWGFAMQIWLLNSRYEQQQQIVWSKKGAVQDRTIMEDGIFARILMEGGNMSQEEYETYQHLFANMSNFLSRPTFIVYLRLSPEKSLERIRLRNRECEQGISLEYLTALAKGYDQFIGEISKTIPVFEIDYEEFVDVEIIAEKVIQKWQNLQIIHKL